MYTEGAREEEENRGGGEQRTKNREQADERSPFL
jgi:hypothetical protein